MTDFDDIQGGIGFDSDRDAAFTRKAEETDEQFTERQREFEQKFAKSDLEEKLQLTDDPIGLLAKELKSLDNKLSNMQKQNENLQEQIDESLEGEEIRLRGAGDVEVTQDFETGEWVIDSAYRGPHWCYVKPYNNDEHGKVLWNTGGYITVGNNGPVVAAADITSELESDGNRYLKYRLTIDTNTGIVTQDYVSNGLRASNFQSATVIHIPIIKYSYDGTIVTVHEQMLKKEPTIYTWKFDKQGAVEIYGLNWEIQIDADHTH